MVRSDNGSSGKHEGLRDSHAMVQLTHHIPIIERSRSSSWGGKPHLQCPKHQSRSDVQSFSTGDTGNSERVATKVGSQTRLVMANRSRLAQERVRRGQNGTDSFR